jgi:hypothetical protein
VADGVPREKPSRQNKPSVHKEQIIDIETTAVDDKNGDDEGDRCGVDGCSAPAFMSVKRRAMHVDNTTVGRGAITDWKEYRRHIAALDQLLPLIPEHRLDDAQNAVLKLLAHQLRIGNHQLVYANAVLAQGR